MKIGIAGISIGIAVMLLTVSIVLGFKREIINKITGLTTHIAISSINMNSSNEPEPIRISTDSIEQIKKFPFVEYVQATAFKNGLLKTDNENEGVLLKGIDRKFDFAFIAKHLTKGRLVEFNDSAASKDILISQSLADRLGLELNQKLMMYFITQRDVIDSASGEKFSKSEQRSRRFTVCGIFKTGFSDFDDRLSLVDLRQIRQLNYWDNDMTGSYEIKIKDFAKLDEDIESVQELLGYNYSVRSVKDIYSNIFTWLDKLDINGIIIVVLMIIVATMNMITALLILILERANMVGLVKALGMSNVSVRKVFMHISLRLITRGMLFGNISGVFLCLLQYYFHPVGLDASTYYVDYVAIEINWFYFLLLNAGTFITCLVMLLLPTVILTKLTPVKTLKFD